MALAPEGNLRLQLLLALGFFNEFLSVGMIREERLEAESMTIL